MPPHVSSAGLTRRRALALAAGSCLLPLAGRAQTPPPEAPLPESVDLSHWMTPAKDQGQRLTCAAFAVNAALEAALRRDRGMALTLSEEFAIYLVQSQSGRRRPPASEEMNLLDVLDGASVVGSLPEAAWPYQAAAPDPRKVCDARRCAQTDPSAHLQAQAAALQSEWSQVASSVPPTWGNAQMSEPASAVNRLRRHLGLRRGAVIAAIKDLPNREEWDDDGHVHVTPRLRKLGLREIEALPNHFVAFSGYDDRRQRFFFKSSWGTDWGRQGYGWISYADVGTPLVVEDRYAVRFPPQKKGHAEA